MTHHLSSLRRWPQLLLPLALLGWSRADLVTATSGDLFLGFRSTGDPGLTVDYLVKLGTAASFRDAVGTFTVSGLGNIGADLSINFGNDWYSRADVLWSVSGATGVSSVGTDPGRTLYATSPRSTVGLRTVPRPRGTAAAQALPSNKIASLTQGYVQRNSVNRQSTSNSPVAVLQVSADINSYGSFVNDTSSYSYFSPGIEGNFSAGNGAAALDLYRLVPATGTSIGTASELVGTFTISQTGVLTFTKYVAPPVLASSLVHNGSSVSVTFGGSPGTGHRIQRSQTLSTWITLATATASLDTGEINFTDPAPPAGKAFYRTITP